MWFVFRHASSERLAQERGHFRSAPLGSACLVSESRLLMKKNYVADTASTRLRTVPTDPAPEREGRQRGSEKEDTDVYTERKKKKKLRKNGEQ